MLSRIERRTTGALLAVVLAAPLLSACSQEKGEATTTAEERPIVLGAQDVAVAARTRLTSGVVLTGSLEPAWQVSVKAQVAGPVVTLEVDRGTRVSEGQVLATIGAEGIRGLAESARAGVAAALANANVAKQRLESARTLREAGAMSALDFQAAQAAYEFADAQLALARAQAAGATEQAERAAVRAPISGVVSSRTVQQGESVSVGDEMFKVVRSDVLELSGEVPVDAAATIRPGQNVVFTLSAQPGREFKGEVARIEPMANPATRLVGVYLRLRNPGGLIGGQFATGRVIGSTSAEVVVIPETAVRKNGENAFVLVVKDGSASRRPITAGSIDAATGLITVLTGLEAGEQVIVTPSAAIAEGARVQVGIPTEPTSSVKAKEN